MITVFDKVYKENKLIYLMGDFNIDLLKDDIDRPTHDNVDLILCSIINSNHLQTYKDYIYLCNTHRQYIDKL